MNKSIRQGFHSNLASLFLNDIQLLRSNYYYFLGKIDTWGSTDIASDTNTPISQSEDYSIRNNAIFFKHITQNDVTLVTDRYDWTPGIVIPQWDHSLPMDGVGFYRFTDEYNVYVCLDNAEGSVSTVKPTGQSFYPIRTSDGYLWKFMYNVPAFKRRRFGSPSYIPVQRALSDSFYNKGSIGDVSVTSLGSGYTDALLTYITASGATTGSGASATVTCNVSGVITGITLVSGGTGYTKGVKLTVTSVAGIGAVLTPTIVAGVITSIAITFGGIGYVTGNSVAFNLGGFAAYPVMSRDTGSIVDVVITNNGIGYSGTPTLVVHSSTMSGSGLYSGNATAILEAVPQNGKVERVLIRDPGINYPVDTATNIVVQGDGTGARFSPVVYNGEVVDVVIEDPGSGYTNATLTVTGGGTGAIIASFVSTSDYTSEQAVVEQSAVDGAIYTTKVVDQGSGYTNTTVVTITGDGTGATATATIYQGRVVRVLMTSYGTGYTYANVSFTDVNRFDPLNQVPKATAYAVLPPSNGHGYDAVQQLNGDTIAISSSLRTETTLNLMAQDYRQFGLMKNPRSLQTGKLVKNESDTSVFVSTFTATTGLQLDEVLFIGSTKFRVVYFNGTKVILQPIGPKLIAPTGTLTAELDSARQYTCTAISTQPVINKYSGNLLYVSNENPFSFTENQGILIKTYLKF